MVLRLLAFGLRVRDEEMLVPFRRMYRHLDT